MHSQSSEWKAKSDDVCLYYSQAVSSSDTSTGGIDAVSLRTLLAVGSQRQWSLGSLDVKSAFLKAPRRSASSQCTLIKPPQMVVSLGVAPHGTLWEVTGALRIGRVAWGLD